MDEKDKSTSTIPSTPAQITLGAIERRDKTVKGILLGIAFIVSLLLLLGVYQLQLLLVQNDKQAQQRSKEATRDRQETKDYIKCLSLIRYDVPADQLTKRENVVKALDDCAEKSARESK